MTEPEPEKPNPLDEYPEHVRVQVMAYYNALKRAREATQRAESCRHLLITVGVDPDRARAHAESVMGRV